jgi:transposase
MDETTIRLLSTLVKCWMKRGQQKRIPTPGQNKWQHVIGALNWRTNELVYQIIEKKNSKTFCAFLEHLVSHADRKRPLFYVLDNASYHHSQVSHAMIAYFEDVAVPIWLPTYCSDLNPIERFWKHLKDNACANRLFTQVQEVVDSVVKVLEEQNDSTSHSRLVFQNIC